MKKTITWEDYLQLTGLLTLAKSHTRKVNDLRDAVRDLLELEPASHEGDHVDDEVWGTDDPNADALLRRLEITVGKKGKS